MHYLYKITNKTNSKIYIGQTIRPKYRWYQHKSHSAKGNVYKQYLHKSINKYGVENFIFEIIATCRNQDDANEAEKILIQQYNSRDKQLGYNIKPGGNNTPCAEETKEKISKANKGKLSGNKNPMFGKGELIQGESNPFYNKTHTEESKNKMSLKRKGTKNPRALLTIENISDIKSNINNLSVKKMAELYNVSAITIYKILDGTNWKDL